MNNSEFAKAIKNREVVFGTCMTLINPNVLSVVDKLGTDFIFIDTEHIPLNRKNVSFACRVLEGKNQASIVRMQHSSDALASEILDGGAQGVLAPYVEDIEQVKIIGATIKYRPLKGNRLRKVISKEVILTQEEEKYFDNFNKDRLFFINIESQMGIDNLENMLKTGFVDGVIIGPHDLSVSIGKAEQYDSKEFEDKVQEIIKICVKNNVSVGNHFSSGIERQIEWNKLGMNMILNSSDIVSFIKTTQKEMNEMRTKIQNISQETNYNIVI